MHPLHEKALQIAAQFRKSEADLLEILIQIDEAKVFRGMGYSSLFDYCLTALKLSEAVAYNFISVARKAREIPELKEAISTGELSVSKARKVVPVLEKDNASEWIQKATELPQRELERQVANIAPAATQERAYYVSESRVQVKLGLSEKVFNQMKRAQDLTSNSIKKPASLEETLEEALRVYLEMKDPVEKAKRAMEKNSNESMPDGPSPNLQISNRVGEVQNKFRQPVARRVPRSIQHQVLLRDAGECQAKLPDGSRCGTTRWTQLHHLKPWAYGGKHEPDNLVTLCSAHHARIHEAAG